MKRIGFVGVFDKTDLILCIARVLTKAQRRVLFIDGTLLQKTKYVIPNISPTISYVTTYNDIDVAGGFRNINQIEQYIGMEDDPSAYYDYILIDVDNYEGFCNYGLANSDWLYYVTSFDAYSLKKGIEILNQIDVPAKMTKLFYSKDMFKEEENYFNYLSLGAKVEWEESKLYFLLENGDQAAFIENQRLEKIKFKNLSMSFKENVIYLVSEIDNSLDNRTIKNIIKGL